jgi:hypothetical protein
MRGGRSLEMEVDPMSSAKKTGIFLLSLAVLAGLAGTAACKKNADEGAAAEVRKAVTEFDGTVKAALGRYMYLPTAQGFDIVLPGFDAASVLGKDVVVKGNLLVDHPPVFLADSVALKADGSNVYTRSQEFQAEDFIEFHARETVPALAITGITKPEEWEGKGRVKIYGRMQRSTVKEGGADKEVTHIVLADDKGKEMAKIVVDSLSSYANYYLLKLRLFDKFWFYLNVKDSVDRPVRTKTKEIFHADVVGVGLF